MDLPGAQNRMGAIFFSLALFGFTSLSSIDGLMLERQVVRREVAALYYRPWAYLATRLLLDGLLLRALPAAAFTALMYPLVGRWGWGCCRGGMRGLAAAAWVHLLAAQ
jgi:hypothetical protein